MKSSIAWHNHRKICMNFIEMQCSINMRSCMILVYSVGQQPFSAVLSGIIIAKLSPNSSSSLVELALILK